MLSVILELCNLMLVMSVTDICIVDIYYLGCYALGCISFRFLVRNCWHSLYADVQIPQSTPIAILYSLKNTLRKNWDKKRMCTGWNGTVGYFLRCCFSQLANLRGNLYVLVLRRGSGRGVATRCSTTDPAFALTGKG